MILLKIQKLSKIKPLLCNDVKFNINVLIDQQKLYIEILKLKLGIEQR